MSSDTADDDLRARVAALEEENAALRSTVDAPPRPRRSRTVLAMVLIILGVLLAPIAVVSGWATWTMSDTERFVRTYGLLARNPAVQTYVVDQAMVAIEEQVDVDDLTRQLVDGLIALGTGPRATAALQALQGSLADGLRSQIRGGLTEFVTSEEFDAVWTDVLRTGHGQLVAVLRNDPQALLTVGPEGSLGIPLGPIVERVKERLVAKGITIADRIPPVDRTVVLVQSSQLPAAQVGYGVLVGLGTWLPWVVLTLLVGGVVAANRRHRAVVWAAGGLALAMVLLVAALAAGRIVLLSAVPDSVLPGPVSGLVYDTATEAMRSTAVSTAVLAVAVALVAWFAGPFRVPRRLRALYRDGVAQLRAYGEQRGVNTGRVGGWVHRRRSLLLGLIAVGAGAVIFVNRPVTAGLVGWTAFWAALGVVVVTLVERPTAELPNHVVAAPTTAADHSA